MRIIGIDPGLRATGWGVIHAENHGLHYQGCGTIKPITTGSMAQRLADLSAQLTKTLQSFALDHAAIEETFTTKNHATTLKLGQVKGVILLGVQLQGLDIYEYAALRIKKAVSGFGQADKQQVMAMVRMLLPRATPDSDHAADALAIALCHAQEHRTQRIFERHG